MSTHEAADDAACDDPRVPTLVDHFETVSNGAMRGMPVVHRALRVEAVGFGPMPGETEASGALLGVLIAPWFMNLVWLPDLAEAAEAASAEAACPRPGDKMALRIGGVDFEWIGAHAPGVGAYACCSLFSPVFEFADQASAAATARAVLAQLRDGAGTAPRRSRRAFLLRPSAFGNPA